MDNNYLLEYEKTPDVLNFAEHITKLGLYQRLQQANYVVIKPNFANGHQAKPDSHIITDIALISGVIKNILALFPEKTIYIAESDSSFYGYAFLKFEHLNLPDSLELPAEMQKNVHLLDLSRDILKRTQSPKFRYYKNDDVQLWLSKTLLESDFVIDLSNLKMHTVTQYTGACKNLFGVLHESEKWIYHTHINEVLHDLTIAVNPALNIVDAFYGMEKNGPVLGSPVDGGFRVWSSDALTADLCCTEKLGIRSMGIGHLKLLCNTFSMDPLKDATLEHVHFVPASVFSRITNRVGLVIQVVGEKIQVFGHRVHNAYTPLQLIVAMVRPVLMAMFGKERLVKLKHRIKGEK